VKDPKKRPSATQLLKHPFVKPTPQTSRKAKNVLAELIDKMVKAEDRKASESDEEEEPQPVPQIPIDNPVASVRKKTQSRKTIVTGASDSVFQNVPNIIQQPQTQRPVSQASEGDRDEDGEGNWDLINSSLADVDTFGPIPSLIPNPLFGQRTDSIAAFPPTSANPPVDFEAEDSFLRNLPGFPNSTTPLPPPIADPNSSASISRPPQIPLPAIPPQRPNIPPPPSEELPEAPGFGTVQRLPMYKTTKRGGHIDNSVSGIPPSPDSPLPPLPSSALPPVPNHSSIGGSHSPSSFSSSSAPLPAYSGYATQSGAPNEEMPTSVKSTVLVNGFPFEVLSAAIWGDRYLLGTDSGLFQLDPAGKISVLIPKTKFTLLTVLDDFGVIVGIAGKNSHIRMYSLEDVNDKIMGKKPIKKKKEPYTKIRETSDASHYSIIRARGTVFMLAAIKKRVILFMWADYPFNKFMKIKDFYVPENCTQVEPIVTEGKISHACVQCTSRFILINVDTNHPFEIPAPVNKKIVPHMLHKANDGRLVVVYRQGGYLLNQQNGEMIGKFLVWNSIPTAIALLGKDTLLAFGPKAIDVYSLSSGNVVQTIRHKDSKKITYLMSKFDHIIFAARDPKNKATGVYKMKNVVLQGGEKPEEVV